MYTHTHTHTHTLLTLLDCLVNHFATFMKLSVLKSQHYCFFKEILPMIVFKLGYGIWYSKEKLSFGVLNILNYLLLGILCDYNLCPLISGKSWTRKILKQHDTMSAAYPAAGKKIKILW